jgi:hypothetical protein
MENIFIDEKIKKRGYSFILPSILSFILMAAKCHLEIKMGWV